MKIAVIGWGSLLWDPRCLKIQGKWKKNGPKLPVEFARKSSNGRLTLVLDDNADPQTTYWILHEYSDLDKAHRDLKDREGTSSTYIHKINREGTRPKEMFAELIWSWLQENDRADAAIWTGLGSTKEGESIRSALDHLNGLSNEAKRLAEEYVRKAPPQIDTAYRRAFREQLGWYDIDDFWDNRIEK